MAPCSSSRSRAGRWLRALCVACVCVAFGACNLNPRPDSEPSVGNEGKGGDISVPGAGGGGGGRGNGGLPTSAAGGSFVSSGGAGASGPLPGSDAATPGSDISDGGAGDASFPDGGDAGQDAGSVE